MGAVTYDLDLEKKLCSFRARKFPTNTNYGVRYKAIKEYLIKNVYNEIKTAALLKEIADGGIPIYLNDHGEDHVNMVIQRASVLLNTMKLQLLPYEIYILLVSILFHDAGNIFGRKDHTKECRKIMKEIGTAIFPDESERRIIFKIASAHGGITDNGSKDTIGDLRPEEEMTDGKVRKRLLASLLRFADELADDKTRASRYALDAGIVPDSSAVFHAYSKSLKSCKIDQGMISLSFDICRRDVNKKYGKLAGLVYLIDEIYERTHKLFTECMYCMRHCRTTLNVAEVKVEIRVFDNDYDKEIRESICYKLQEVGYPSSKNGVFGICPNLKEKTGLKVKKGLKV